MDNMDPNVRCTKKAVELNHSHLQVYLSVVQFVALNKHKPT